MNRMWLLVVVAITIFTLSCNKKPVHVSNQQITMASMAVYRHNGPAMLNDTRFTPGVVRTTDVQEICHGGSTKQFRNTTQAMKNEVYKEYGAKRKQGICTGGCEVDHLISLEIGGADDVKNLWPQPSQPKPGFHEKDKLENWLHTQICTGKMSPQEAQSGISADWYSMYLKMEAQ